MKLTTIQKASVVFVLGSIGARVLSTFSGKSDNEIILWWTTVNFGLLLAIFYYITKKQVN